MNKLKLAMNAWRVYTAIRNAEGSSLRGKIKLGIAIVVFAVILYFRNDMTPTDVGVLLATLKGMDSGLDYFIPDMLGAVTLTAERGETNGEPLPPINLIAES